MNRKLTFCFLSVSLLLVASCQPDRPAAAVGSVRGYTPVYAPSSTARRVSASGAIPTVRAGKVYAYQNFLFQVEQEKGIHVIDNSNSQQAAKVGFINVPGCSEIAVRNGYLYTNNINDLVVINITNPLAPVEVSRQADAFPQITTEYPPFSAVYFDCVDPTKGVVIGWEEKQLTNPQCRR